MDLVVVTDLAAVGRGAVQVEIAWRVPAQRDRDVASLAVLRGPSLLYALIGGRRDDFVADVCRLSAQLHDHDFSFLALLGLASGSEVRILASRLRAAQVYEVRHLQVIYFFVVVYP